MASAIFVTSIIMAIIFGVIFIVGMIVALVPVTDTTNKTNGGYAVIAFSVLGVLLGIAAIFMSKGSTTERQTSNTEELRKFSLFDS